MLIRQQTRWLFRKGGCGTFDEGSEKSGDGGFADESGEELELKTGQRFDSALVAGFMMLYKLAINLVRYYYRC